MNEIAQPHDRLFKALLSHPETAGAFLRENLPPEVARLLGPEPPLLVEGSFIEERLQPYFSDRLFQAMTLSGKPLFLYALLEHKSYEDKKAGWQLCRGLYAFLEQQTRADEQWQKLPAIVALLLHHGQQEWRIPNEFMALMETDEALRPWLLNFRFPVVDLGPIPDDQLSRHARLRAGLMALKYGTRDPQTQMDALENITVALQDAPELLLSVLLYLLTTFPYLDEEHVRQVVRRINPQEEAEMMSQFAQEILAKGKPEWVQMVRQEGIQMGEQKGRQEGRQEGEATILARQLQRRFGNLPVWVSEKIANAESPVLEEWSLRILDAPTLESVFADLS
ncbi:MAG: Rpn family recombination-promoting nuclease/putative transposase [Magnetococcales bacterium]|nr:Rpn family recombination-promoting nuclease/putative transposase [Magnetococcales bacterium]